MNNKRQWFFSLTTAILVPTLLPTVYFSVVLLASPYPNSSTMFIVAIVAFLASLGHVAVLGIPGLLLLSRTRQFKAWAICLLGFILGCLPMSIWSWPLKASLRRASNSHWDGEKIVHSMVDGVPTLVGWVGLWTRCIVNGSAWLGLRSRVFVSMVEYWFFEPAQRYQE